MITLARILAFVSVGVSSLLLFRVKLSRGGIFIWVLKLLIGSLAPLVVAIGALGAVLGSLLIDPLSIIAGVIGAAIAAHYAWRVTAPHDEFEKAFGVDWQRKIAPEQQKRMLKRRWTWWMPGSPEPRWARNIPFYTIRGTERQLLCDIWQPPTGIKSSGLAFIYFHGGGWHGMNKDSGTRPLFRHLAAQGHIVMDVAYRLCPEVDVYGMMGDVKRAIAWMKSNAGRYGVNPERVVVAGGSAGAHLSLLAAYAPGHPELTPDDVKNMDTSVRAVVSYYGPTDLRASYEYTRGFLGFKLLHFPSNREQYANFLGGQPDEVPEMYDLASPTIHVSPNSPPTLLFHGEHDSLVSVEASRVLYHKLVNAGVPVVYVQFPQTDHGFDLFLPQFSPPAQAALYDLDRFLALMV